MSGHGQVKRILLTALTALFVGAVVIASAPSDAIAQLCSYTIGNMSFGNIDVTANTTFAATGTLTIACTGNRNRTVRVCPNIGSGSGDATASQSAQAGERHQLEPLTIYGRVPAQSVLPAGTYSDTVVMTIEY